MPVRARPGDRAAVEAALTPSLRAALEEACRLLEVRPDGWQATPLQQVFETCAVLLEAARIRAARRCSARNALESAATRLGVPALTVRNRTDRWSTESVTSYEGRTTGGAARSSEEDESREVA